MRMLLALCLLAPSLSAAEAGGDHPLVMAEEVRVHPVPDVDLALSAPASWRALRKQAGAALVLRSPAELVAGENAMAAAARERTRGAVAVTVQPLDQGETPAAFAQRCRADLERLGTSVAVSEQTPITLAGRQWVRLRYRFEVGQFTWEQLLYATVIADAGVCVTCSSDVGSFAKWEATFAAIIASTARSRPTLEEK